MSSLTPSSTLLKTIQNTKQRIGNDNLMTSTLVNESSLIGVDAYTAFYCQGLKKSLDRSHDGEQSNDTRNNNEDVEMATIEAASSISNINTSIMEDSLHTTTSYAALHNQAQQRFTTNENSVSICNNIQVAFLCPISRNVDNRADGSHKTKLKDCFGQNLVVVGFGFYHLLNDVEIEIAAVSSYEDSHFYSRYTLWHEGCRVEQSLRVRCHVTKYENGTWTMKLPNLLVEKIASYDKLFDANQQLYRLICYPSNTEVHRQASNPNQFSKKYKLDQFRLALRFFLPGSDTPLNINGDGVAEKHILFSNMMVPAKNFSATPENRFIQTCIQAIMPAEQNVEFFNNKYSIELSIKLPDEYSESPDAECKRIEISLMNKNEISSLYLLASDVGNQNVLPFQFTGRSFGINLTVVKQETNEMFENPHILQALCSSTSCRETIRTPVSYRPCTNDLEKIIVAAGLNQFYFKCRFMHAFKTPDGTKSVFHPDDPMWCTHEFTEFSKSSNCINSPSVVQQQQQQNLVENVNLISMDTPPKLSYDHGE